MRSSSSLLPLILFLLSISAFGDETLTPEEQEYVARARQLMESIDWQQGQIVLPGEVASLDVPETFHYLSPEDAEKVLVEAWGNPPGAGLETLGLLFPAELTPFDEESWAVSIEYSEDGYVSDEDADEIDYDELLEQMQNETAEASEERVAQGYEPIELVGWASPPFYDAESHKLHWAKEIRFGDQEINTLNYNIRVLGRHGFLMLNFIAGMDQKPMIDEQIDSVLAMAQFDQGSRYEDFDPDIDVIAGYGLGALVAGKVAAKTGLFAAALLFLKKFGILIVAGIGGLFARFFKRKKQPMESE